MIQWIIEICRVLESQRIVRCVGARARQFFRENAQFFFNWSAETKSRVSRSVTSRKCRRGWAGVEVRGFGSPHRCCSSCRAASPRDAHLRTQKKAKIRKFCINNNLKVFGGWIFWACKKARKYEAFNCRNEPESLKEFFEFNFLIFRNNFIELSTMLELLSLQALKFYIFHNTYVNFKLAEYIFSCLYYYRIELASSKPFNFVKGFSNYCCWAFNVLNVHNEVASSKILHIPSKIL